MQEVNRLEQLCQTVFKVVWHLMGGTCADVLMFPSHSGVMECPRSLSILWEVTARNIKRTVCHDDVARQIIVQELKAALDLWMCSSWQDLVEETDLRSWEEARHNIFLRLAKSAAYPGWGWLICWNKYLSNNRRTLDGAHKWMSSRGRVFWDQGIRDEERLAREVIPLTSRPSLSRHLLFTEENMVNSQETSFVQ